MTNKELVNQISGLNSTSTLKNWIQLIKEISGKEFKREMRLIKIENSNLKKKIQDIEESMQTGLLGFVNKRSKNRFG